jgi:hypothetical protein
VTDFRATVAAYNPANDGIELRLNGRAALILRAALRAYYPDEEDAFELGFDLPYACNRAQILETANRIGNDLSVALSDYYMEASS